MGQSSGSVGPAIGGSPFGGLRVLSPTDIARASPQYDPYTASRRPNYMPYGPNQQFYQPIYQPSYSQFSPMGYGQLPFGGFYQPPMMGFGQQFGQPQFGSMNFQGGDPGAFRNALIRQSERKGFGQPQQNMFGPATDISNQGQAALRQMSQQDMFRPAADIFGPSGERTSVLSEGGFSGPMLSPQPMQTQYRPIPFASQTTIDQLTSKARSEGAAEAAANQAAMNTSYGASGGKVHEEGIDSLLKK